MPTQLFSIEQSRKRLAGMGRAQIYALIRSGELRSLKIGRRRYITDTAIEEFLSGREGRPA